MEEWHLNRVAQSRVETRQEMDRRNGEEGRGEKGRRGEERRGGEGRRGWVRTVTHLQ